MKRTLRMLGLAAVVLSAAALGACTTTGMGAGELSRKGQPEQPVLLSWKSHDGGISGTMVATLPDATYQGRFFQITRQTRQEGVAPLWDGWAVGWPDWPYWGWRPGDGFEWVAFSTRYTGKVLANLQTDGGRHMRCRFHLAQPLQGMGGGGDGECQLQGGAIVRARF